MLPFPLVTVSAFPGIKLCCVAPLSCPPHLPATPHRLGAVQRKDTPTSEDTGAAALLLASCEERLRPARERGANGGGRAVGVGVSREGAAEKTLSGEGDVPPGPPTRGVRPTERGAGERPLAFGKAPPC